MKRIYIYLGRDPNSGCDLFLRSYTVNATKQGTTLTIKVTPKLSAALGYSNFDAEGADEALAFLKRRLGPEARIMDTLAVTELLASRQTFVDTIVVFTDPTIGDPRDPVEAEISDQKG